MMHNAALGLSTLGMQYPSSSRRGILSVTAKKFVFLTKQLS
jgi:hypothetical protein